MWDRCAEVIYLCSGLQILVTRDSGSGRDLGSGRAGDSSEEPSEVRASAVGEKPDEAGGSRSAGEKASRGLGVSAGRVGLGADRT